jgi:hypothetical protein
MQKSRNAKIAMQKSRNAKIAMQKSRKNLLCHRTLYIQQISSFAIVRQMLWADDESIGLSIHFIHSLAG